MLAVRRLVVALRIEREIERDLRDGPRMTRRVLGEDRRVDALGVGTGRTLVVVELHDDHRRVRARRRRRQREVDARLRSPVALELVLLSGRRRRRRSWFVALAGRAGHERRRPVRAYEPGRASDRRNGVRDRQCETDRPAHQAADVGCGGRRQPGYRRGRCGPCENEDADDRDIDHETEQADGLQHEEGRIRHVHGDREADRRPDQQVAVDILPRGGRAAGAREDQQQHAREPNDTAEGNGDSRDAPVAALVDLRATDPGVDVAEADMRGVAHHLRMDVGGNSGCRHAGERQSCHPTSRSTTHASCSPAFAGWPGLFGPGPPPSRLTESARRPRGLRAASREPAHH